MGSASRDRRSQNPFCNVLFYTYLFLYFSLECTSAALSSQRAGDVNYRVEKFGPALVQQTKGRKQRSEENKRHAALMTRKNICFHILVLR